MALTYVCCVKTRPVGRVMQIGASSFFWEGERFAGEIFLQSIPRACWILWRMLCCVFNGWLLLCPGGSVYPAADFMGFLVFCSFGLWVYTLYLEATQAQYTTYSILDQIKQPHQVLLLKSLEIVEGALGGFGELRRIVYCQGRGDQFVSMGVAWTLTVF